jgi:large subunit ribosomal protein L18
MLKKKDKTKLAIRHRRIRKKISGDSERPRLCVHRSLQNIQAQIIDDLSGRTLVGVSSLDKDFRQKVQYAGNIKGAEQLGSLLAEKAKKKGITKVCFDRGGYLYHGRIKALAESARKAGLEF